MITFGKTAENSRSPVDRKQTETDLTDADVADLVAYLKTPTCCYQLQDPPKNPRYNADKVQWPVQSALKGGTRGTVETLARELRDALRT